MCMCRWKVWGRDCTSWCTQRSPSLRHADWGRFVGLQAGKPGSRGGGETNIERVQPMLPDKIQRIIFPNSLVCIFVRVGELLSFLLHPFNCYASKINCQRIRPWCLLVSISFLFFFSFFFPSLCPLGMLHSPGRSSVACEIAQST